MWYYQNLIDVLGESGRTQFKPLPRDVTFQLAMRRSVRVGEHQGRPLEELGIKPDVRHYMTKNDLMNRNTDMVRRAAGILATKPLYHLSVHPLTGQSRALRVTASSKVRPRDRRLRIDRVDVSLNGRPRKSLNARSGILPPTTVTLGKSRQFDWLVQAFDYDNNLVAISRRHS